MNTSMLPVPPMAVSQQFGQMSPPPLPSPVNVAEDFLRQYDEVRDTNVEGLKHFYREEAQLMLTYMDAGGITQRTPIALNALAQMLKDVFAHSQVKMLSTAAHTLNATYGRGYLIQRSGISQGKVDRFFTQTFVLNHNQTDGSYYVMHDLLTLLPYEGLNAASQTPPAPVFAGPPPAFHPQHVVAPQSMPTQADAYHPAAQAVIPHPSPMVQPQISGAPGHPVNVMMQFQHPTLQPLPAPQQQQPQPQPQPVAKPAPKEVPRVPTAAAAAPATSVEHDVVTSEPSPAAAETSAAEQTGEPAMPAVPEPAMPEARPQESVSPPSEGTETPAATAPKPVSGTKSFAEMLKGTKPTATHTERSSAPTPAPPSATPAAAPSVPKEEPVTEESANARGSVASAEDTSATGAAAPDATPQGGAAPAKMNGSAIPRGGTPVHGRTSTDPKGVFLPALPDGVREEEVEECFQQFGDVHGCRLVSKKGKPPIAFIDFKEPAAASKALQAKVQLRGQEIPVKEKKLDSTLRTGRGEDGGSGRTSVPRGAPGARGQGRYSDKAGGSTGGRGGSGRGGSGGGGRMASSRGGRGMSSSGRDRQ